MLEFFVKFERIRNENHLFEKVIFLSFISIGVFMSKENGRHLGISLGLFSFEVELAFRSWLVRN